MKPKMKPKISVKQQCIKAGLVAALVVSGSAISQTLPKEGGYDFTACYSGIANLVSLSKTHSGFAYEVTGTNRSNPPGAIMDNTTFRCVGMSTSLGAKKTNYSLCEVVDRDGDKQLAYISLAPDGKTSRETVAGTGKYEGMEMSGTLVPLGSFPFIKPGTFQACNHQTGTYKLK